jgi:hypothetical protein
MFGIIKDKANKGIIGAIVLSLTLIAFGGCTSKENIFTIGITCNILTREPLLKGLKKGMSEYGYLEDENIKYIFNSNIVYNPQVIDADIKNLPGDIPFETTEAYLTVNLKTAEKIGIQIPDIILAQAKNIIKEKSLWMAQVEI